MSPRKHEQILAVSLDPANPDSPTSGDRLGQVEAALGVTFSSPDLLRQALVHASYLNEQEELGLESFPRSNERLEFLGDAVLGLIVADYLYHRHDDMDEGNLTVNRATLVRTETLARWTRELGLGDSLYIARGEGALGDRVGDRIMAGAFEALVGALYLDQGIEAVRKLMERLLDRDAESLLQRRDLTNYKGELQEILQGRYQTLPEYEIVETRGPAHDRYFVVEVVHQDTTIGHGGGRSRRLAEQEAAKDAIERLQREGMN